MMAAKRILARKYKCPRCHAGIGEPCQSEPNQNHYLGPNYRTKLRPHKERLALISSDEEHSMGTKSDAQS